MTEEYKNCDICANDIFRDSWQSAGVERKAFPAPSDSTLPASATPVGNQSINQEHLVQTITDLVMKQLAAKV
jgi:L-fuculose-phosphate aldolase